MTMMSSQNQGTNRNTAKTTATKLRNVKPSEKKNMAIILVLLRRFIAGVARGLGSFGGLRHASDPGGRNARTAPSIWQGTHAFSCRVAARRTRGKLRLAVHGESATCRLDMCGP